ncbi:MAG: hypothetical protein P8Y93_08870 [Acidobacteriota bacterium]
MYQAFWCGWTRQVIVGTHAHEVDRVTHASWNGEHDDSRPDRCLVQDLEAAAVVAGRGEGEQNIDIDQDIVQTTFYPQSCKLCQVSRLMNVPVSKRGASHGHNLWVF